MKEIYLPAYKAMIETTNLRMQFWRLNRDVRDIMCDDSRPEYEPCDSFSVKVSKLKTETTTEVYEDCTVTRTNKEVLDTAEFRFNGKDKANEAWRMANHGASFEIVAEYLRKA